MGRKPKLQFLVIDTDQLDFGDRHLVGDEERACQLAETMGRPLIVSGSNLALKVPVRQTILVDQPLEVSDEKPETEEKSPKPPAETPEDDGRKTMFAIKRGDEDLWISDEGVWDSHSKRMLYESESVANEVADRVGGSVIPLYAD